MTNDFDKTPILATLAALLIAVSSASAGEWPRYRGPGADGRSAETGLLAAWAESGPPELWRAELGDGYSGLSIAGGRLFTLYGSGRDELAVAFDAATGRELWRVRTGDNRSDGQGGGPRSTPTVDGDSVYLLGALGVLHSLEAASGEVRWRLDLARELGAEVPRWGVSTSPLVEGDLLIVDVGGRRGYSLVAFDKASGAVRWHANDDKAGYSTPLAVTIEGVRQIVSFSGTELVSVDAETGEVLWSYPWRTDYDVNAAMPVFLPPDRLFISSSYDSGAAMLEVRRDGSGLGVEEIWKSRVMRNHFNSSVLVDGYLYGFDNGTLKCIDPANGEERWAKRGFAKGSLIYADGRLVILSERGELALAEADSTSYRELARFRALDGRTWTMPSLADGLLFVRDQGTLLALDLRGPQVPRPIDGR